MDNRLNISISHGNVIYTEVATGKGKNSQIRTETETNTKGIYSLFGRKKISIVTSNKVEKIFNRGLLIDYLNANHNANLKKIYFLGTYPYGNLLLPTKLLEMHLRRLFSPHLNWIVTRRGLLSFIIQHKIISLI